MSLANSPSAKFGVISQAYEKLRNLGKSRPRRALCPPDSTDLPTTGLWYRALPYAGTRTQTPSTGFPKPVPGREVVTVSHRNLTPARAARQGPAGAPREARCGAAEEVAGPSWAGTGTAPAAPATALTRPLASWHTKSSPLETKLLASGRLHLPDSRHIPWPPSFPHKSFSFDKLAFSYNISYISLFRSRFSMFGRILLLMRVTGNSCCTDIAKNAAKVSHVLLNTPDSAWLVLPVRSLRVGNAHSFYKQLKYFLPLAFKNSASI